MNTSSHRHRPPRSPIPPRASLHSMAYDVGHDIGGHYHQSHTTDHTTDTTKQSHPPVFSFGCGMLIVISLLLLWYLIIVPTYTKVTQQWEYGTAKITRVTADVGHGGNSTFLAWDEQGAVVIVEFIDTHPDKTHVYTGPSLTNDTTTIVGITIEDINGDGKPDLVITAGGSQFVLVNTGSAFSWLEK